MSLLELAGVDVAYGDLPALRGVDLVVEAGETLAQPTTVVDWSEGYPEVVRRGAGDPSRFEE